MDSMKFKAYAVTNEIDLNKIAIQCGIPKKYTWEEPLILQGEVLDTILQYKTPNTQKVLVFSFGSIVTINTPDKDTIKFLEYLKSFKQDIDLKAFETYTDDYELRIGNSDEMELNDQYAIVPKFEVFYPELVSIVIAKSVALEKTEDQLGQILDRLETMIDRVEKGNLRISDKELAKATSRIVRHEYNTIAYIMILDKPDITWANSDAAEFYDSMAEFFELNDRYEIIKKKTDILNNIMNGFASISHSIRGLFVEWVIVILIVIEVILMIADMLS
ncbi:MAG: RMD1 family protein [Clostridia bacterium]|nr:RMD1 family protein [Clostridia bacterium]